MTKQGLSSKEIAEGMYQYHSKKSSLYRRKWSKFIKLSKRVHPTIKKCELLTNCFRSFSSQERTFC